MIMGHGVRRNQHPLSITFGDSVIQEVSSYTHLGIIQSSSAKYPFNIDNVRQSIRGNYFSLANVVGGNYGANPHVISRLYTACVLPRALFACELWTNLTKTDLQKLESTHHLCLKNAQGLPFLTRSDMVTGLLGFTSIETYIDQQRLQFFGALCRQNHTDIVSKVFMLRIFHIAN